MAATRKKNMYGNYCLEQRQNRLIEDWQLYKNGGNGFSYDPKMPGFGLNPGQHPWQELSHNPADIETFLWGIGSNNMIKQQSSCFTPQLRELPFENLIQQKPVLMPTPLAVKKDVRPFPLP